MQIRQEYFEIRDIPTLRGRSWIPLRQTTNVATDPPAADILRGEEFTGIATAAVFSAKRSIVDSMGWGELGLSPHRAGMDVWGYRSADVFRAWSEEPLGINLVINQNLEQPSREIWHLHPDLIIALRLMQEGDCWYRPAESWVEVIRLKRDENGKPILIEMRTEFLADYLAARGMDLFCSSYSERILVSATEPTYGWPKEGFQKEEGRDVLEAITRVARYPEPKGAFWTRGAIWRTEWVEAGKVSVRVRGDKDPHDVTFALEKDGSRVTGDQLKGARSWLYFEPTVVSTLLRHRGAQLHWHSRETGGLGATGSTVHFGINDLGLITVYAKDIGYLPMWEQRLWSAHNVTPDGKVSRELFAAQMEVNPASTKAPEGELHGALETIDSAFSQRFGVRLLRGHESVPALLLRAHRFQAVDTGGLLELSKELTRLFAERVEVDAVVAQLTLAKGAKRPGSLKAIEKLLGGFVQSEDAKAIMGPLFGIYDLRLADAHLGSSSIEAGKERAGVKGEQPPVMQGRQLLQSFIDTLQRIADVLA